MNRKGNVATNERQLILLFLLLIVYIPFRNSFFFFLLNQRSSQQYIEINWPIVPFRLLGRVGTLIGFTTQLYNCFTCWLLLLLTVNTNSTLPDSPIVDGAKRFSFFFQIFDMIS